MFYRRLSYSTSYSTSYSMSRSRSYSTWRSVAFSCVLFALAGCVHQGVSANAFAQDTARPRLAPQPQAEFKAPPEVEQALRARVTEFFQLHVESNFQKAYGMVAEDTKKYYFDNKKNTYKSFRIVGVKFVNSDFTKASVDLECEQVMERVQFNGVVIPVPMTTLWKIEDGKWMWYRDPNVVNLTPMGASDLSKINAGATDEQIAARLKELTSPESIAKRGLLIVGQSGIDKPEVTLAMDKPSSAEVTFHNGQAGYIKLVLDPGAKLAGFNATLDKVDVGANENAVLKLSYDPPAGSGSARPSSSQAPPQAMPQAVTVKLFVQPFNQVFPVTVHFGSPAAANHQRRPNSPRAGSIAFSAGANMQNAFIDPARIAASITLSASS